jgi:hypothetical protein
MPLQGDRCRLCELSFDWNLFQRLQPGFEAKDYLFDPPKLPEGAGAALFLPGLAPDGHAPAPLDPLPPLSDEILFAESSTKARHLIEEIRLMETEHRARVEKYELYLKRFIPPPPFSLFPITPSLLSTSFLPLLSPGSAVIHTGAQRSRSN